MPLNVQLKSPYVATLEFKQKIPKLKPESAQEVTNKLIAAGHDGVVFRYDDETTEAVVFNPANVRSTSAQFEPEKFSQLGNVLWPELFSSTADDNASNHEKLPLIVINLAGRFLNSLQVSVCKLVSLSVVATVGF
jgi:hypothetical protein